MDRDSERRPALVGYLLNSCLSSAFANWIYREPRKMPHSVNIKNKTIHLFSDLIFEIFYLYGFIGRQWDKWRSIGQGIIVFHILKVMTLYLTPYLHTSLVYVCIHCPVSVIIPSKDKSACYRKSQVDQEQGCWCLFLDVPLWFMFCSNACASVIVGCDSSCQSKPSKGPRWKIWKKINWITKQLVWLFSSQAFD